jgi:hypothetical protein
MSGTISSVILNARGNEWSQIMFPYDSAGQGRAEYWDGVSAGPVEHALIVVVHLLILVLFQGGGQLQGHLSPPIILHPPMQQCQPILKLAVILTWD